jgi:hypothetical protein
MTVGGGGGGGAGGIDIVVLAIAVVVVVVVVIIRDATARRGAAVAEVAVVQDAFRLALQHRGELQDGQLVQAAQLLHFEREEADDGAGVLYALHTGALAEEVIGVAVLGGVNNWREV